MKKTEVILVLFILLLLGIVYSLAEGVIVGLSIIDIRGTIITLIEPLNNSGDADGNITFFYNFSDSSDLNNCSLIINNKINATNKSVIKKHTKLNFTLNNTAIGSYNWSINCTDNLGFNSTAENRTFTVIFMKNFNGSSTNLSLVNVTNVTNFVVELTTLGTINFSDTVDLSQGLDLDRFINISSNNITLDADQLNALNKSATLYIYGLTFTNPRPLRDGVVCPSSICTEVPGYSKAEGTFVFDVTQFSSYTSEETPVVDDEDEEPGPSPGGGAGAGGGGRGFPIAAERLFVLSTEALKVTLKQGEEKDESFTIKNIGDFSLGIKVNLNKISEFLTAPTEYILNLVLQPDEQETINLSFKAEEDFTPDVYPREITITGAGTSTIIFTIIEIESAKPLFDVDVEVLPEYKIILPGSDIFLEVSLFNVRGFGRVDVILEYSIRDFQGKIWAMEEETVAVETQAKFTREILVPSDIPPGTYVSTVRVIFEDSVGISSDLFEVRAKAIRLYPIVIKDFTFFLLLGIIVVIIITAFVIFELYVPRRKHIPKTIEEEEKIIRNEEKIKKLNKELSALEQAYNAKFISEGSYNKHKERIEGQLKKLR